jgi:hypothetical protein
MLRTTLVADEQKYSRVMSEFRISLSLFKHSTFKRSLVLFSLSNVFTHKRLPLHMLNAILIGHGTLFIVLNSGFVPSVVVATGV